MPIVIIILYACILLLSIGISGYLSYHGLLTTANEITLPLVIFLMTVILAMDLAISYYRSVGRPIWIFAMGIWSVAAFFSIASNFNFLYTNFMREEVAAETVADQLGVYRDDLVSTRAILLELDPVQQARQAQTDLAVELDNLYRQIGDPLRPGCGERCQQHLQEIQSILGQPITDLAIPPVGSDPEVVQEWYDRYRAAAEDQLETRTTATRYSEVTMLARQIDEYLVEFSNPRQVISEKGGLDALAELSNTSRDVEREANTLLSEGQIIEHTPIDPALGQLGEIVYSFQNGFVDRPNPMATTLSMIMASIVDVLPLLIAFALFGKGRLERPVKSTADRGRGGRKVFS